MDIPRSRNKVRALWAASCLALFAAVYRSYCFALFCSSFIRRSSSDAIFFIIAQPPDSIIMSPIMPPGNGCVGESLRAVPSARQRLPPQESEKCGGNEQLAHQCLLSSTVRPPNSVLAGQAKNITYPYVRTIRGRCLYLGSSDDVDGSGPLIV
jgi:hypothetical protein